MFAVATESPIMCTSALGAGVLTVTMNETIVSGVPLATIMDVIPEVNIPSMGECTSLGNPQTASQTAAAGGVLTPGTCVPVPAGPWECANETVLANEMPLLDNLGMVTCSLGGEIKIVASLCVTVQIP